MASNKFIFTRVSGAQSHSRRNIEINSRLSQDCGDKEAFKFENGLADESSWKKINVSCIYVSMHGQHM